MALAGLTGIPEIFRTLVPDLTDRLRWSTGANYQSTANHSTAIPAAQYRLIG
jgi:hypothetical protein